MAWRTTGGRLLASNPRGRETRSYRWTQYIGARRSSLRTRPRVARQRAPDAGRTEWDVPVKAGRRRIVDERGCVGRDERPAWLERVCDRSDRTR